MTVAMDIPLGKSVESELLDMLEKLIGEARLEAHDKRVEILTEFSSRGRFVDANRVFATFVLAARKHGLSKPEGRILSELLAGMCEQYDALLGNLLSEFENEQDESQFIPCATRTVRSLSQEKRRKSLKVLVEALARQRSTSGTADYLVEALVSMNDNELNLETSSFLSPQLDKVNGVQVFLAARVISRIGGKEQFHAMLKVLQRTLEEWYDGQGFTIQSEVIRYFQRNPGEQAVPLLTRLMKTRGGFDYELVKAAAGFQHSSTARALMEVLEDSISGDLKWEQLRMSMSALSDLDPSLIDLNRLLSHARLFENSEGNFHLTKIMLKLGSAARPILLDFLQSENKDRYSFATGCLAKMGFTPDEMAEVFGESPVASIYRFFYPEETAEKIWSERDPGKLGGPVKGFSLKRFDYLMLNVLTALNLAVLYVDSANKKGVDFVALSASTPHMIVAGATLGPLKDDIRNLNATLAEMRGELREIMERYVTFPVIFTADPVTPDDLRTAAQAGIIVLGPEHVRQVITMSRTGRTCRDLVKFLSNRKDEIARMRSSSNPFETAAHAAS